MKESKLLRAAVPLLVAACLLAGGCGGSAEHAETRDFGSFTATIPAGWDRVPLIGLPGASVPLQIASAMVRGGVGTICDPQRIVRQLPAGGALVQIVQESGSRRHGPGAVGQVKDPARYKPLHVPFRLGPLHTQECGEAYKPTMFRLGGQVFALRIWTPPTGPSAAVRGQIEELMESMHSRG